MVWPFGPSAEEVLEAATRLRRGPAGRAASVTRAAAMKHSAVWACSRLRADLISTMPVDVFRRVTIEGKKVQVEVPKPPVLSMPGGAECAWIEWMESTQRDLDSVGNTVGIITATDGSGLPARIELQPIEAVQIKVKQRRIHEFIIDGTSYQPDQIWHEKQHTIAGSPVGMSPIAHAAMAINGYTSAQTFAADWFGSPVPKGHLKNVSKTLQPGESTKVKARFKESLAEDDLFVSGQDWEYKMISAKASESQFLESQKFSVADICRFMGVPGDMIDAESSTGTITYANITQRNLQLLIMNIGPAITRREDAISRGLLAQPRYIKLNTAALLRMDLKSRYEGYRIGVEGRWLPPSRILDLENQPPLTPEEEAEFARLFPSKAPTPAPDGSKP